MKKPKSKATAPIGYIEPEPVDAVELVPEPEPEPMEAMEAQPEPESEAEMPIFHLSLSEWQMAQGIKCSCRHDAYGYHGSSCALVTTVAEWRAQCHERHDRIRHAFPLLKDFKDGWARESEQTMKDRLRMQAERAS